MSNLYSRFIEITTLTVVVISVYLLSMEIQKYTEATNVATYQKIIDDANDLQFDYHTNPFMVEATTQIRINGRSSLSPEQVAATINYGQSILRLTETSFMAWKKGIFSESQKQRFSRTECFIYKDMLSNDINIFPITGEYRNYLENTCKDLNLENFTIYFNEEK